MFLSWSYHKYLSYLCWSQPFFAASYYCSLSEKINSTDSYRKKEGGKEKISLIAAFFTVDNDYLLCLIIYEVLYYPFEWSELYRVTDVSSQRDIIVGIIKPQSASIKWGIWWTFEEKKISGGRMSREEGGEGSWNLTFSVDIINVWPMSSL